jgi:phosphonate transport system ATP-binding protein
VATLLQEAAARGATLICSLHQVDVARTHFPRIVGLKDGRIVFDLPREAVTDAMIAALYQNEQPAPPDGPAGATPGDAVPPVPVYSAC